MDLTQRRAPRLPVVIRDAVEADVPFIFNSWLKSFRNGSFPKGTDNSIYFTEQHKLIERLLKTCSVKIAADPKDPQNIFGYIVFEQIDGIWVFHYAYTKHSFRALGVARELARSLDHDFNTAAICSHHTFLAERICPKYNLIYHPYILINYNDKPKQESSLPVENVEFDAAFVDEINRDGL